VGQQWVLNDGWVAMFTKESSQRRGRWSREKEQGSQHSTSGG